MECKENVHLDFLPGGVCCLSTVLQVGTRYTLLKVLGSGSFSSVVSALDNDTQEKVRGCVITACVFFAWGGGMWGSVWGKVTQVKLLCYRRLRRHA